MKRYDLFRSSDIFQSEMMEDGEGKYVKYEDASDRIEDLDNKISELNGEIEDHEIEIDKLTHSIDPVEELELYLIEQRNEYTWGICMTPEEAKLGEQLIDRAMKKIKDIKGEYYDTH